MTKPFLMGAEVEYSMSVAQRPDEHSRVYLHLQLLDAIRAVHHWLDDCHAESGLYLDNGSRYYLDAGCHNEFSSPELFAPQQVATYDRAGEQILLRAKAAVAAHAAGMNICITKNNVNFHLPDRAAWGQHEAYTCWTSLDTVATWLIPHIVSRSPYAGAGCLSSHPQGMGFELSQRARHMTRLKGTETTHDRAIFCTRAWKPTDVSEAGWTRTNLICKDSQRCSFGMYLTYGVTGLLFMIANEGHEIGSRLALQDPVAALRTISLDPFVQTPVPLANGKQATAVDIQRAYLAEARPYVESGDYPDWTYEVLGHWAETLDRLETDPLSLADRLDTYLKLTIFDRQLVRAATNWAALRRSLETLERMRNIAPEFVVQAVLGERAGDLTNDYKVFYDHLRQCIQGEPGGMDSLRFAVRLQALELKYHELGGLFDQLAASGCVDPVVVAAEDVEHAIHNPPAGGRAEIRGKSIVQYHGQPWACDWQHLINHHEKKWIDLRDPFKPQHTVLDFDANALVRDRLLERRRLIRERQRAELLE